MKMKRIYFAAIFAALLTAGCTSLDTYPEGQYVTSEQKEGIIKADPSKEAAGVNGIFAQYNVFCAVTGDRHNDFGYPAIMLITDCDGIDCLGQDNGYNWFSGGLDFSNRIYTSYESEIVWKTLYSMIYTANGVISGIKSPEAPLSKFYLSQGLCNRAFCYWVLAQLYQFNYQSSKDKPCVPVVTDENAEAVTMNGCARASVEDVYKQILADLDAAISYLSDAAQGGVNRTDKRYFDLGVAYGLRARANLTMGNWAAAANDAQSAIEASGATPYSIAEVSTPTFVDSNDHAWMWGDLVAENDRVVTSGIVNWPSHMGSFNYGYCWYGGGHQINKALFNSISDTDVRKGWWIDENCYSANLDEEQEYVINSYAGYPPYTQVKFAPYKYENYTSINANDIPLMRVEEMYLIKAEGEYMANGSTSTLVDFVQTYRDPDYSLPVGTDIQDEIWRQRRLELWGEGLSWFDLMRLGKGVDRRGAGFPDVTSVRNVPADHGILLWRIPECEINANALIPESENNPAVSAPDPCEDFD